MWRVTSVDQSSVVCSHLFQSILYSNVITKVKNTASKHQKLVITTGHAKKYIIVWQKTDNLLYFLELLITFNSSILRGINYLFRELLYVLFMQQHLKMDVLQGGTARCSELGKLLWRSLRSPGGNNTTPHVFQPNIFWFSPPEHVSIFGCQWVTSKPHWNYLKL